VLIRIADERAAVPAAAHRTTPLPVISAPRTPNIRSTRIAAPGIREAMTRAGAPCGYNRSMVGGPLALAPELDDFRRQFEAIAADADALIAALRDDQFTWSPAPEAWSIAQCLDHLNATARHYLPVLDEGISEAIRRGVYGEGPFTYSWLGRLLVFVNEPPVRFRARARHRFNPAASRPRQEIVAALRAYQVQYVDRLRQANGLDLARARVRSPLGGWVRMSLGSGFAVMAAHERRHIWQARRITELPAFPA
jgi:hypothetical protein